LEVCYTKLKADEQVNIVDTVFDWEEKKIRHYDANKFLSTVTEGSEDILVNNTNPVAVEQKEGQLIKLI
jgi:hypothetical protein